LGLVRESGNVAAVALGDLGVSRDAVRRAVISRLSAEATPWSDARHFIRNGAAVGKISRQTASQVLQDAGCPAEVARSEVDAAFALPGARPYSRRVTDE